MSNAGNDYKSQVLDRTSLVELIGQSVALKKRGKDYVGLCPFHNEKSPSFKVDPAKQYYYCFGCKASGNAIDFVMKRDRVEFLDALKSLGQAAGVEMPRFGANKEKDGERKLLLDAQSAACAFFEGLLAHPQAGAAGREYLGKRGINAESVKRFQIGLAADGWDALLRGPVGRKFSPQVLARAGLVKARENGGGFYDAFRNRLMFPIRDERGQVIAFGGRVMPGSGDPAKYLNSPETPLFSKSRSIFGLDLAKTKLIESRTVAVVEGYTDVVMAHQFGASNVVSILGTSMTEEHLRLLRRFLPDEGGRIVLLFDADAAGNTAVDRTIELFLTQPVELAIASMPEGVDPDEYVLQHGAEGFARVLSEASDVLSYKWKQLARKFMADADDLTGQQKAVQHYLELLAGARGGGPVDSIRWGMALARVSRLTGIPEDDLNRRFRATRPGPRKPGPPAPQRVNSPPGPASSDGADAAPAAPPAPRAPVAARERAERWLLGALLTEPRRWHAVQLQAGVDDFTDPLLKQLAEVYWAHQRDEGEPVFREFLGLLTSPGLAPGLPELAIELLDEIEALLRSHASQADPKPAPKLAAALEGSREKSREGPRKNAPKVASGCDEIVAQALTFLAGEKRLREQQKLMARLRRSSDGRGEDGSGYGAADGATAGPPPEGQGRPDQGQNEEALFAEFLKKNQATNLHRLGPVRRFKSE